MNTVKRLFVLLASASMFLACGASQRASCQALTDPLSEVVGQEGAVVLTQPSSVTVYVLQNSPGNLEVLPGYFRHDEGKLLTSSEQAVARFLLTENPANFIETEGPVVSAPFLPFVELCFRKGKQSLSILVSTMDMTWSVVKDGQEIKNFPYRDVAAVERFIGSLTGEWYLPSDAIQ